jgi:hypothetical protein
MRFIGLNGAAGVLAMALWLFAGVERAPGADTGSLAISGRVTEALEAAPYTYVQIDTGKEKVWAAAPQFEVKAGDKVSFKSGMLMENFKSKTLNRTFAKIYFVESMGEASASKVSPVAGHGIPQDDVHRGLSKTEKKAALDFSGIKKPEGGLSVAEVYQQKSKLAKKQVVFRGKVVKYNAQILKRNWLHVQDGTGSGGANDITVTSQDAAKVGDTVVVKGTVTLNKDYGHGYKYDLVVEDAKVEVE